MSTPSTTSPVLSTDYRVSSLNEAGEGRVSVNFVEIFLSDPANPGVPVAAFGSFTRAFSAVEAADFFPGQVYTLTITKKS